jgi:DNA-binding phage protein
MGLVSNAIYFMFVLIMVFLVVTNYKGMTAVMKQGGTSTVHLVKALQGR